MFFNASTICIWTWWTLRQALLSLPLSWLPPVIFEKVCRVIGYAEHLRNSSMLCDAGTRRFFRGACFMDTPSRLGGPRGLQIGYGHTRYLVCDAKGFEMGYKLQCFCLVDFGRLMNRESLL